MSALFGSTSMPATVSTPQAVDYSQVSSAYANQMSAMSAAAGMSNTNKTGGTSMNPAVIAGKQIVGT